MDSRRRPLLEPLLFGPWGAEMSAGRGSSTPIGSGDTLYGCVLYRRIPSIGLRVVGGFVCDRRGLWASSAVLERARTAISPLAFLSCD